MPSRLLFGAEGAEKEKQGLVPKLKGCTLLCSGDGCLAAWMVGLVGNGCHQRGRRLCPREGRSLGYDRERGGWGKARTLWSCASPAFCSGH